MSFANGSGTEPAKMTVTVNALPEGTDVRSSYFDVEVFGMKKRFYVAQHSEAGVSDLAVSATKAFVNGGEPEGNQSGSLQRSRSESGRAGICW